MAGIRADVSLNVNTSNVKRSLDKATNEINKVVGKISGKPVSFNVNGKSFTQPLGRITASANEFSKSLEASNARVIAFGASVGIINGVSDAFRNLVLETIRFEKVLSDINVVLGLSNESIQRFGEGIFDVAMNTAQSFNVAADAALEFSRQGLSTEEVLKRTNDALILTRLTSLNAADAVAGLTAAVNAFGDAGLTTTDIIDKLAAVDVKFAVSSEDLINGLQRAGAVAIDAGVELDSLVGLVAALQQTTARGGAVIGNSLKTIFTRIQRPESIRQIEDLGVAVRNIQGEVLSADRILLNMAKSFNTLTQAQQSNVVQFSAGIFQANVFRSILRDLAKEQSLHAQATEVSANASGEAAKKNEILNKTLAALASQAGTGIRELAGIIGELALKPEIGGFLEVLVDQIEGIKKMLGGGEDEGNAFAKGLVRGIGNVITGPAAIAFGAVFIKMFLNIAKFASTSLKDVLGIVSQKDRIRQMEESIVQALSANKNLQESLNNLEGDRLAQEKFILGIIEAQTSAMREQQLLASRLAKPLIRQGVNPDLTMKASGGLIPQSTKNREREGARKGGYAPGSIDSMDIPGLGPVVYNKAETVKQFPGMKQPAIMPPKQSRAGSAYKNTFKEKHGFDPYASHGFVPNFAMKRGSTLVMDKAKLKVFGTDVDIGRAVNKKYQEIQEHFQSKLPINIEAGLQQIITSSTKDKKQPTGKESLFESFSALSGAGIKSIERPFDVRSIGAAKSRGSKPKGLSPSEFSEKKVMGLLKREQSVDKVDKKEGYRLTHDPQTNKGLPDYPVDIISYGENYPTYEVKSGSFNPANLIFKSLRMASDRELPNWMQQNKISGGKKLQERKLKKAETLSKRLDLYDPKQKKSAKEEGFEFSQDFADQWGLSQGFVPNFKKDWRQLYSNTLTGYNQGKIKSREDLMGYLGVSLIGLSQLVSLSSNSGNKAIRAQLSEVQLDELREINASVSDKGSKDWKSLYSTTISARNQGKINSRKELAKSLGVSANGLSTLISLSSHPNNKAIREQLSEVQLDELREINASVFDKGKDWKSLYSTTISAQNQGKINSREELAKSLGVSAPNLSTLVSLSSHPNNKAIREQLSEVQLDKLRQINNSLLSDKSGTLSQTRLKGDLFEKAISILSGQPFKKGKDALDFSRAQARPVLMDSKIREQIDLGQDVRYGDAESGSGHKLHLMRDKVIRELEEGGQLYKLIQRNGDINLPGKTFTDIVANGSDAKPKESSSTTLGKILKSGRTTAGTKNAIEKSLTKKYKGKITPAQRQKEYQRNVNFDYYVDDVNLENLKVDKRTKLGKELGDIDKQFLALSAQTQSDGLVPNFASLRSPIKFDVGDEKSYGKSYVARTAKSGKLFLLEQGHKHFSEYMESQGKPTPKMTRGVIGGREGYWVNQHEDDILEWSKKPNIEYIRKEKEVKEQREQESKDYMQKLKYGSFEPIKNAMPLNFGGDSVRYQRTSGFGKELINKLGPDYKYISVNTRKIEDYAKANNITKKLRSGSTVPNSKSALLKMVDLPKSKIQELDFVRPRKRTEEEKKEELREISPTSPIKWDVRQNPGTKKKDYSLKGSDDTFRHFSNFLERKGVPKRSIQNIQNAIQQKRETIKDLEEGARKKSQSRSDNTPFYQAALASENIEKNFSIPTDKLYIKNLSNLIKEFNSTVYTSFSDGYVPDYGAVEMNKGYVPNFIGFNVPKKSHQLIETFNQITEKNKLIPTVDSLMEQGVDRETAIQQTKDDQFGQKKSMFKILNKMKSEGVKQLFFGQGGKIFPHQSAGTIPFTIDKIKDVINGTGYKTNLKSDGFVPNYAVTLSDDKYYNEKSVKHGISQLYKKSGGRQKLAPKDLEFAAERYISAIKDSGKTYPGGNFNVGGKKFNFNEVSMALMKHGQFYQPKEGEAVDMSEGFAEGLIPNYATKIRNGAIYHSKTNNKAVRVKRADQAERIAYIKHHTQDHMFDPEVPFSDLTPATKKQVQEYLGRSPTKAKGFVPNFADTTLYRGQGRPTLDTPDILSNLPSFSGAETPEDVVGIIQNFVKSHVSGELSGQRHKPNSAKRASGAVSFSTSKTIAREFSGLGTIRRKATNPDGKVFEKKVPQKNIFSKQKLLKILSKGADIENNVYPKVQEFKQAISSGAIQNWAQENGGIFLNVSGTYNDQEAYGKMGKVEYGRFEHKFLGKRMPAIVPPKEIGFNKNKRFQISPREEEVMQVFGDGLVPNFADPQKIRNGAIYHSQTNNKAVRVVRANQAERIAYIKHHAQDHMFDPEVPFSDLTPASKKQVQEYLGRKSKGKAEGFVPNFAVKAINSIIDGDSVEADVYMGTQKIDHRLSGVDAVEKDQAFGTRATTLASKRYSDDKKGRKLLEKTRVSDGSAAYNRGLFKDRELAKELVLKGYGIPDLGYLNKGEYDEYSGYVNKAKKSERGIWGKSHFSENKKTGEIDYHHPKARMFIHQSGLAEKAKDWKKDTSVRATRFKEANKATYGYASGEGSKGKKKYSDGLIPNFALSGKEYAKFSVSLSDFVRNNSITPPIKSLSSREIFKIPRRNAEVAEQTIQNIRQFISSNEFGDLDEDIRRQVKKDYNRIAPRGLSNPFRPFAKYSQKEFSGGIDKGRPTLRRAVSKGFVPNFASPLKEAIKREKAAGVPVSSIRVEKSPQLKSSKNPMGLAVTNTRDEPLGVGQGIRRARSMGIDPKKHGASKGLVPNFAAGIKNIQFKEGVPDAVKKAYNESAKHLNSFNKNIETASDASSKRAEADSNASNKTDDFSGGGLMKLFVFQSVLSMTNGFLGQLAESGGASTKKIAELGMAASDVTSVFLTTKEIADQIMGAAKLSPSEGVGIGGLIKGGRARGRATDLIGSGAKRAFTLSKGLGGVASGFKAIGSGLVRFVPLIGQAITAFSLLDAGIKNFTSVFKGLPVVGGFFSELQDGEGIFDLFKTSAERAAAQLERLAEASQKTENAIESSAKLSEIDNKIKDLETKGATRTLKENEQLYKLTTERIKQQGHLIKQMSSLEAAQGSNKKIVDLVSQAKNIEITNVKELNQTLERLNREQVKESTFQEIKKTSLSKLEDKTLTEGVGQKKVIKTPSSFQTGFAPVVPQLQTKIVQQQKFTKTGQTEIKAIVNNIAQAIKAGGKEDVTKNLEKTVLKQFFGKKDFEGIEGLEKFSPSQLQATGLESEVLGLLEKELRAALKAFKENEEVIIIEANSKAELEKVLFLLKETRKSEAYSLKLSNQQKAIKRQRLKFENDILSQFGQRSKFDAIEANFARESASNQEKFQSKRTEIQNKALADTEKILEGIVGTKSPETINRILEGEAPESIKGIFEEIKKQKTATAKTSKLFQLIGNDLEKMQSVINFIATKTNIEGLKDIENKLEAINNETTRSQLLLDAENKEREENLEQQRKKKHIDDKTVRGAQYRLEIEGKLNKAVQNKIAAEIKNAEGSIQNLKRDNTIQASILKNDEVMAAYKNEAVELQKQKNINDLIAVTKSAAQAKAQAEVFSKTEQYAQIIQKRLEQEISQSEIAARDAQLKNEFYSIESNRLALVKSQLQSEIDNLNTDNLIKQSRLELLTQYGKINELVAAQIQQSRLQATTDLATSIETAEQRGTPESMLDVAEKMSALNREMDTGSRAMDALRERLAEAQVNAANLGADLVNIGFDQAKSGLKQLFKDIGSGAKSASEAWESFGLNIADSLLDRIMEHNIDKMMSNLSVAFTGQDLLADANQRLASTIPTLDTSTNTLNTTTGSLNSTMGTLNTSVQGLTTAIGSINLNPGQPSIDVTVPSAPAQGPSTAAPVQKFLGGKIQAFNKGGFVKGEPGIDRVPAMLTAGEYVLNKEQVNEVQKQGPSTTVSKPDQFFMESPKQISKNIAPKKAFEDNITGKLKLFKGGLVKGEPGIDRVPAMLTAGEYVLNKEQVNEVQKQGPSTTVSKPDQFFMESPTQLSKNIAPQKTFEENVTNKLQLFNGGVVKMLQEGGEANREIDKKVFDLEKRVVEKQQIQAIQKKEVLKAQQNPKQTLSLNTAKVEKIASPEKALEGSKELGDIKKFYGGKIQKFEEGGVAERVKAGAKGAAQFAVMSGVSSVLSKKLNKKQDNPPPKFDMRKLDTLDLGSDVNIKRGDPRLSARFIAEDPVMQEYRDHLLELATYRAQKTNEKFRERQGTLASVMGAVMSFAVSQLVSAAAKPVQKSIQKGKNFMGKTMGQHKDAYKNAINIPGGKDLNYSQVSEAIKSNKPLMIGGREWTIDKTGTEWMRPPNRPISRQGGGSIPAMLTAGEGFVPAPIARRIGYGNLNKMNQTGSLPIINGPAGIDKVGPVGLNEGDFIIKKSSTDKLLRENPNMMKFALQNPEGFKKGERGYYEGGVVGTATRAAPSAPKTYKTQSAPEQRNRISSLIEEVDQTRAQESAQSTSNSVTNNINVNVSIDKSGNESVSTEQTGSSLEQEKDLSMKIKAKVLEVIRDEKRIGGELS